VRSCIPRLASGWTLSIALCYGLDSITATWYSKRTQDDAIWRHATRNRGTSRGCSFSNYGAWDQRASVAGNRSDGLAARTGARCCLPDGFRREPATAGLSKCLDARRADHILRAYMSRGTGDRSSAGDCDARCRCNNLCAR
jgi:hypothetical protein